METTELQITSLVQNDASQVLMQLRESDLDTILNNAMRKINNGEGDPIAIMATSQKFIYLFTELQKRIREKATNELAKYRAEMNKSGIELEGATFSFTSTPRRYDYSDCEDWRLARQAEKDAADKRKGIEKAMQSADYLDQETGQLIKKLEPVSGGNETVRVSIK